MACMEKEYMGRTPSKIYFKGLFLFPTHVSHILIISYMVCIGNKNFQYVANLCTP